MIVFKNRSEAGRLLAEKLTDLKNTNAIILGLPRGGVVTAKEIADALALPLDIIVTRKIGAPENEEYAIGAIDIDGSGVWNESERQRVTNQWLTKKIEDEKREAKRRWSLYRGTRGPLDFQGKTTIIVDDGVATGLTMCAAVAYAKRNGAEKVIIATPVAASDSVQKLNNEAEIRVLEVPYFFSAVGEWYEDFPQVSDEEVIAILKGK